MRDGPCPVVVVGSSAMAALSLPGERSRPRRDATIRRPGGLRSPEMTTSTAPARLDAATLAEGVRTLATRDRDLAGIVARHGPPPLWDRTPGFATLVAIVLEQQVSLRSGAAALARLEAAAGSLDPAAILGLDEA